MERPPRSKGANIFKYLPKATSFNIPNKRPEHPAKNKIFYNKAFSGPIISIVPEEARRKKPAAAAAAFDDQEPTSPKISCIGQIKHKKSDRCKRRPPPAANAGRKERRSACALKKMFRRKVSPGRRPDEEEDAAGKECLAFKTDARAPVMGQMRRFTSGRSALAGFDWREAPIRAKDYDDDYEEEEVIVPHSAPILMGGGLAVEPKKEVNIWKRRTLAPPNPLQLSY